MCVAIDAPSTSWPGSNPPLTYFLTYEDAARAVERLRLTYPRIPHLRDCDAGLVLASLGQPSAGLADGTRFHATLHRQAAVLLYHVAKAHACLDGNKRIAATLMLLFISMNGWAPFFPENEIVAFSLYATDSDPGERDAVLSQLATWIEARIRRARPATTGAVQ